MKICLNVLSVIISCRNSYFRVLILGLKTEGFISIITLHHKSKTRVLIHGAPNYSPCVGKLLLGKISKNLLGLRTSSVGSAPEDT